MQTKLIWITPEAERLILYMARVSNPKNQNSTNFGLIDHLLAEKHWSPLEMANACFEIKTSRRISPQILRHRSFNFQEYSQRYSKVEEFEEVHPRRQDTKNRQNSIDDLPNDVALEFIKDMLEVQSLAKEKYDKNLEKGIAKECCAFFLPGTAATTLYMNGTIRSWVHYIQLRSSNGTQKEHMDIANSIKKQLIEHLPHIAETLGWKEKQNG